MSILPVSWLMINKVDIYNRHSSVITILNIIGLYSLFVEYIINNLKWRSINSSIPKYFLSLSYIMTVNTIVVYRDGYFEDSIRNVIVLIILNILFYFSWSQYNKDKEITGLMYSSIIFTSMMNLSLTFEQNIKMLTFGWLLISCMNIYLAIVCKNIYPLIISTAAPISIIYQTGLTNLFFLDFILFFIIFTINSLLALYISKNKLYLNGALVSIVFSILINNISYNNKEKTMVSIMFLILLSILTYYLANKFKSKVLYLSTYISATGAFINIAVITIYISITLLILLIILLIYKKHEIKKLYYQLN